MLRVTIFISSISAILARKLAHDYNQEALHHHKDSRERTGEADRLTQSGPLKCEPRNAQQRRPVQRS